MDHLVTRPPAPLQEGQIIGQCRVSLSDAKVYVDISTARYRYYYGHDRMDNKGKNPS